MARIIFKHAERALWWAFLATIGFQTRWIVWQADTQFIEWRAAAIYATDVLFIALLVFSAVACISGYRCRIKFSSWDVALAVFVGVALVSVIGAEHGTLSWIALARLVQGILLYGYVRFYALKRFDRDLSLVAFILGALAQALLGLSQFLLQHEVGLHALGETILHPSMRGVAVFHDLAQIKILRAYGTMPHPNALAMLLALALSALGYLYLRHSAAKVRRVGIAWFMILGVLLWGLLATFSRTIVAALTGALAVPFVLLLWERISDDWANVARLRRRARDLFLAVLIGSTVFGTWFWPQVLARMGISVHEEAVQLRSFYNAVALSSGDGFLGVNWFGAGIGNFVTWLMESNPHLPAWQYQPAHNLFLLIYTEMGIFGLISLGAFLFLLIRALVRQNTDEPLKRWGLVSLAGMLVFASLFDHFFWTLQQGRLLFWLFWAVAAGYAQRT